MSLQNRPGGEEAGCDGALPEGRRRRWSRSPHEDPGRPPCHGAPRFLIIAIILLVGGAIFFLAQAVLVLVALAVLLAFLLAPIVSFLGRRGLGRVLSVLVVVVLVFLVLGEVTSVFVL